MLFILKKYFVVWSEHSDSTAPAVTYNFGAINAMM